MATTTTNYSLSKPAVNDPTDEDLWGTELNNNFDIIDAALLALKAWTVLNKTADYTVTTSNRKTLITCDATSANIEITLLSAATAGSGFNLIVKKTDASTHTVTITPDGSETIDGKTSQTITLQNEARVLVSDGTNWQLTSTVPVTDVIKTVKAKAFATSGTYTPSAGMAYCWVRLIGGGGGGGGVAGGTATAGAGGGGSGGYTEGVYSAATVGASQTVTIGAGGTATAGGAGGNGGTTSFGALLTGSGGYGAAAATSASYFRANAGGNAAATGMSNPGNPGCGQAFNDCGAMGGCGGAGWMGGGAGKGPAFNSTGAVQQYAAGGPGYLGGGGGGAATIGGGSAPASAGGAGGRGYCYIIEFCTE